ARSWRKYCEVENQIMEADKLQPHCSRPDIRLRFSDDGKFLSIKSPTSSLNLEDWLHTSPPIDIYVLGFQEIVPLNAGNMLGTEDNIPAKKWLALIRRKLDNLHGTSDDSNLELDSDFEESTEKNQSFSN
ncbi:type I inositol polyphosphate 5-phosphatase 4, partial [Tanacetum coccineum]